MEQQIKAVIFDMNGVLALGIDLKKESSGISTGFHNLVAKKLGINPDTWFDAIDSTYADSIEGKISEKKTLEKISKNLDISKTKLEKIIINAYKKLFRENKSLYDYAFKLKKKGYKIAILSDQWHLSKKAIYNPKKIKKFDTAVTSCDAGMRKPNPKIYRLTLKKLKVRPSESIFVDNRDWNLKPARKLGMKAVLFRNTKQAIKDIEKFLKKGK